MSIWIALLYDNKAWFHLDMVQDKEKRKQKKKTAQTCFPIIKQIPLRIQSHFILVLFLFFNFYALCIFNNQNAVGV